MNRTITHTNSSVRVKVFHYENETTFNVDIFEIDDVLSVNTSKDIGSPSGNFSIAVAPGQNWKKKVRPGDWVLIYFSNGQQEERLKFFGNVDRVSRSTNVSEEGVSTTRYMISGRDFGKVFEKTNIYYNPWNPQTAAIQEILLKRGVEFRGSPDEIILNLIDVFLGNGIETITSLNQWFIPASLKKEIVGNQTVGQAKQDGPSFYDILNTDNVDFTKGYRAYSEFTALHGYLWNVMKMNSNEAINEMFTELHYDKDSKSIQPCLFLRTIPFADENFSLTEEVGTINKFVDLERVEITDEHILMEDVGESDHVRFNFFFLTMSALPIYGETLSTFIGGEFPQIDLDSIKKHGLLVRTDNTEFSFLSDNETNKKNEQDGTQTWDLLKGWNKLMVHWYEDAYKLESGTMRINGNVEVEIGKTLEVYYSFSGETYLYYIEGYENEWEYPNLWTTSLKLTRGRKLDYSRKFIEESNDEDKIYTGISNIVR